MIERCEAVTLQGAPLTLLGQALTLGQDAPDFEILSGDLNKVTLSSFDKKIKVFCSVPSLDTPVCDMEIKRFHQAAEGLAETCRIIFVSMDLPFAQKRFCQAFGVSNVGVYSDHRLASFGVAYGVLIKELRLLSRAVFIVDQDNKIVFVDYLSEITQQPDYQKILDFLRIWTKA